MASVGPSAIDIKNSNASGAASDVSGFFGFTVSVENVGSASYQVQISLDPASPPASSSWVNEGNALTANGSVFVQKPAFWARIATSSYVSGTATAHLAGCQTTR